MGETKYFVQAVISTTRNVIGPLDDMAAVETYLEGAPAGDYDIWHGTHDQRLRVQPRAFARVPVELKGE